MMARGGKRIKFSKGIVITMFATVIIFVAVMIFTYWHRGGVPDVLIERFFAFFGIEGGALGIIKVSEVLSEKMEFKKSSDKTKNGGKEKCK